MFNEQIGYAIVHTSWSSIIAGAVTALALSMVLGVIGVALGFKKMDFMSHDPMSGVARTFSIWSGISVIISLAGGGFIAGLLSAEMGLAHGFLVWAVVAIAAVWFGGHSISAAIRTAGAAVRRVSAGALGVAATVGKNAVESVSDMASAALNDIKDNVTLHIDTEELKEKGLDVLKDTEVESLQPEYLQKQMKEAQTDLKKLIREIKIDPANYEALISDFLEKGKVRLDKLTKDVDRDAAINVLVNKTDFSKEEAEKAFDNAMEIYHKAVDKAKESLDELHQQIEEIKIHLKNAAAKARKKADEIAEGASKAAMAAAVALIIAAVVSMAAAYCGTAVAQEYMFESIYYLR